MPDQSLSSWKDTLIDYVRSGEPDLTNRQMALLMLVYLDPGPHTVRGLARALNVSKPVVTRALNRLGALGYLRRQRDETDKRNIFVARTAEGADFLAEFGQFIGGGGQPIPPRATPEEALAPPALRDAPSPHPSPAPRP